MAAGDAAQLPASRSVDKALEEASASGALNLSNRKLKEFPRSGRNYDLSDITRADLSKNQLCELPEELCHFVALEALSLYHNGMRSLSSSLGNLQALTYLNLSRNLLSSLPPAVFHLPLLRVLIVSNNKLCSLPASVYTLTHLRQLDVSCNELQCLPAELGQLKCLRDLNLRRNQLTSLPEEISELPLVRLDVSCNRISNVPLCYRHLRHLQSISMDNNPLQMPPAQICAKGKYHIFKYLNIEACKRSQEELQRHLRPTGFNSCLSDQELFSGQFGGLDSGFNSVDSGSKRWSGNESVDGFSELSLRMADVTRDQRNLEEEEEEEDGPPLESNEGNGEAEQVDLLDGSVSEEEVETGTEPVTAPPQEQRENSPPSQSLDSAVCRLHVELGSRSSASCSSPLSPTSPTLEEKRRPGTLLIWQERERLQQERETACLLKSAAKTGSHMASTAVTGSGSVRQYLSPPSGGSPASTPPGSQRAASADRTSPVSPATLVHRFSSRTDAASSPETPLPLGKTQKPTSFLFHSPSCSARHAGSAFDLGDVGRSESRISLCSPENPRPDITQLRKTLESRLGTTLPEDLGEALSNGAVLCQLANRIRPRSVSTIHVPSPAVPTLSAAKSRLNVENFIDACRRLGVPETSLCASSDVLLSKLPAVLCCVMALMVVEGRDTKEEPLPHRSSHLSSSLSSLLSTDFLLFYCTAMVLLCVLYCYLLP
ncbi:leucine-rich repeat and calponin homology domain-containing protein 4 [Brachionichthys hirsutus]|uniref:leucine-rich repeat and calponin homology domain-containing protein 4 n=1 Tax=Brachionichthys hirsutus TaxID=412623 RepID=UPI003604C3A7